MRRAALLALLLSGCARGEKEWPLYAHLKDGQEVVIVDQSLGEKGFPPDVLGREDPSVPKFEHVEQSTLGRIVSDHRKPDVRLVAVRIVDGEHSGKVLWFPRSCLRPR